MAAPLCLGIAMASGAPLFSGIIAGIVGGLVVTLISSSQLGVSGPAAGLTVIVLQEIQVLGSFEVFLSAVMLAGAVQVALGLLRAGSIGYDCPTSVIKGMLSGIGIIIILKQIPHAFGYDSNYAGDVHYIQAGGGTTFKELFRTLDFITPGALLISTISLAIHIFWDLVMSKKHKVFQIILGLMVVVGIILPIVFRDFYPQLTLPANQLVTLPVADSVNGFVQQFTLPDFSRVLTYDVLFLAGTIAIVASLETLLCVEATDTKTF